MGDPGCPSSWFSQKPFQKQSVSVQQAEADPAVPQDVCGPILGACAGKSRPWISARPILEVAKSSKAATSYGSLVASNMQWRVRHRHQLTLADTSIRQHWTSKYPKGACSRHALNSAETKSILFFSIIFVIFSFSWPFYYFFLFLLLFLTLFFLLLPFPYFIISISLFFFHCFSLYSLILLSLLLLSSHNHFFSFSLPIFFLFLFILFLFSLFFSFVVDFAVVVGYFFKCFSFFSFNFIYLVLERGEGKEKDGEKHQCVVASHVLPTGDLACNPGMCPDWEWNWQPFGSKAGTQSLSHTSQSCCWVFFLLHFPLCFVLFGFVIFCQHLYNSMQVMVESSLLASQPVGRPYWWTGQQ